MPSPTSQDCESPVPSGKVAHATQQGTSGKRPEIPPRPRVPPSMLDLIRTYGPVPRQESSKPHLSGELVRSSSEQLEHIMNQTGDIVTMDEPQADRVLLSDMPTAFLGDWKDITTSVRRVHIYMRAYMIS